jgi:cytochrome c-type biogenesis protein CcmH
MRGELAANLERGDSNDLTLQAFVQKYGTTVLIAPTMSGFNRLAWVMPYLVLALGLASVIFVARTWRMRTTQKPTTGNAPAFGTEAQRLLDQARRDTDL